MDFFIRVGMGEWGAAGRGNNLVMGHAREFALSIFRNLDALSFEIDGDGLCFGKQL